MHNCKVRLVDFQAACRYTFLIKTEEVIMMRLGNSLFHARKKCGLSQEEVAEKLGVSRQTISKWETEVSQTKGY